jgi:sulfofructose kinase
VYEIIGIDMPCIDLNVNVDKFPQPGIGENVQQLSWQGGGKVASGMVACARLDAGGCAMMGCVGDDNFGKFILDDFKRHGIETRCMTVHAGETSSLSIVLSDTETHNRTFVFRTGSAPRYKADDFDMDLIKKAKYLFICHANTEIEKTVDIAREAGVKIFIDADGYSPEMARLIPKIDVFVGSEQFYMEMFGGFAQNDIEWNCFSVYESGPEIVVFTFGDKGCAGISTEGFFTLPAFNVKVQDTVGAGDVFHGGFLAGLLNGRSVKDAALLGSAVAAIKCTRIGGRAGIPDLKTAERFLRDGFIDYAEIDERVRFYSELNLN